MWCTRESCTTRRTFREGASSSLVQNSPNSAETLRAYRARRYRRRSSACKTNIQKPSAGWSPRGSLLQLMRPSRNGNIAGLWKDPGPGTSSVPVRRVSGTRRAQDQQCELGLLQRPPPSRPHRQKDLKTLRVRARTVVQSATVKGTLRQFGSSRNIAENTSQIDGLELGHLHCQTRWSPFGCSEACCKGQSERAVEMKLGADVKPRQEEVSLPPSSVWTRTMPRTRLHLSEHGGHFAIFPRVT